MKRTVPFQLAAALLGLQLIPMGAVASDCVGVADDAERLRCYDVAAGRAATPPAAPPPSPAPAVAPKVQGHAWSDSLQIRDALGGSKKGAAIAVTREQGDTRYRVNAAAIFDAGNSYLPEIARFYNWSWKVGAQLSKDSSPAKPVDGRTVRFGASGNLLTGTPLQLTSFVDVQAVTDRVASTRDIGLRYSGELRVLDAEILERGVPYSLSPAYFIVPMVGLHVDRHREDGANGRLFGGHVGLGISYYPGGALYRAHLFGDAIRARDFGQSGAAVKRSSTWFDLGVEYAFTDPRTVKDKGLIPTLSLKRTLGSNFLTGEADTAQTVLSLSLRFN